MRIAASLSIIVIIALAGCGGGGGLGSKSGTSVLSADYVGVYTVMGLGLPSNELSVQSNGNITGATGTALANTQIGSCSATGVITISGQWTNGATYNVTATGSINTATSTISLLATVKSNGQVVQVNGQVSGTKNAAALPNPPADLVTTSDPVLLTFDNTKYAGTVVQYQVVRDYFGVGVAPVKVLTDAEVSASQVSVAGLYGTTSATQVSYYALASSGSATYSAATNTVNPEAIGKTHTYQVRALYKHNGLYYYAPVSNTVTATATDPVKTTDIISPVYVASAGPTPLSMAALKSLTVNFTWKLKTGADGYCVRVEPLTPLTAPIWQSPTVLALGGYQLSLPSTSRIQLANLLAPYPGVVMTWRVYSRHQGDTSQAWLSGDENQFVVQQ